MALMLETSVAAVATTGGWLPCYVTDAHGHWVGTSLLNPIQTGLFLAVPGLGGVLQTPPPHRFLKTIKDIDMKLTPLIKRREINPLLLSYLSCDVT